jgi:hypothetical protein
VRLARATRGFLKSGTPLAMASTPVKALQPEAKARSTRNTPRVSRPLVATSVRGSFIPIHAAER